MEREDRSALGMRSTRSLPHLVVNVNRSALKLLEGVLPLRHMTIDDGLILVACVQQRNHRTAWAHRKRRLAGGSPRAHQGKVSILVFS